MKANCKECGHFKDNHYYGETTDKPEKIGQCLHVNCDCESYEPTITTNDKIKAAVEEFKLEFLAKGSECTWETYPLATDVVDWLQHRLETLVREEREECIKEVENYGEAMRDHLDGLIGKSHRDCREMLVYDMQSRLIATKHITEMLTPPITNNKN